MFDERTDHRLTKVASVNLALEQHISSIWSLFNARGFFRFPANPGESLCRLGSSSYISCL
jgi:hypothetical protein